MECSSAAPEVCARSLTLYKPSVVPHTAFLFFLRDWAARSVRMPAYALLLNCASQPFPGYTDATMGQLHLFVSPGFRESTAGGLGAEGQLGIHSSWSFWVHCKTLFQEKNLIVWLCHKSNKLLKLCWLQTVGFYTGIWSRLLYIYINIYLVMYLW